MKLLKCTLLLLPVSLLMGCLEPDLPKCDSKETKTLTLQIINQALKSEGETETLVSLKNIEELAFNKQSGIRVCKSDAVFSNAAMGWLHYKIYWGKSRKGGLEKEFFVEITDSGDYE